MSNSSVRKYEKPTDSQIREALAPFGITPTGEASEKIRGFIEILSQWNEKISLTGMTGVRVILERHFGESMFAAKAVAVEKGRLADVGSGAGFPGLALKIIRPELRVALIESNGKKAAFLSEVVRRLGMSGVEVLRCRFEKCFIEEHSLDVVTSRAVVSGSGLLNWAKDKLNDTGRLVLWTGRASVESICLDRSWAWEEPIGIPLSRSRVLLVGSALDRES